MIREFNVHLTPEDDGRWTAEVPALPGCVTWGNTKKEALERIKEAIGLYLEVMAQEGKPIPANLTTFKRL